MAAPAAGAVARAAGWGKAIEVPGLARLSTGQGATLTQVSCSAPGNCAAGGIYSSNGDQAFVASENNGRWGKAIKVPGVAALSGAKGGSGVVAVSCTSAGCCVAGGNYTNRSDAVEAFVISRT